MARKKHIRENHNRYEKQRYRTDPLFALNSRMARAIRHATRKLDTGKSQQAWCQCVGYTVEELKRHIEKKFTKGMSWTLMLQGKIHIDHIIPKSAFHFTSIEDIDFKKCLSLDNLRPMWAEDNMAKSNKLSKPFQPSLPIKVSVNASFKEEKCDH